MKFFNTVALPTGYEWAGKLQYRETTPTRAWLRPYALPKLHRRYKRDNAIHAQVPTGIAGIKNYTGTCQNSERFAQRSHPNTFWQ